jgi:hypothetical protein
MTEGSGSDPLANGSGSGSRRPKSIQIRIRNTVLRKLIFDKFKIIAFPGDRPGVELPPATAIKRPCRGIRQPGRTEGALHLRVQVLRGAHDHSGRVPHGAQAGARTQAQVARHGRLSTTAAGTGWTLLDTCIDTSNSFITAVNSDIKIDSVARTEKQ